MPKRSEAVIHQVLRFQFASATVLRRIAGF